MQNLQAISFTIENARRIAGCDSLFRGIKTSIFIPNKFTRTTGENPERSESWNNRKAGTTVKPKRQSKLKRQARSLH
jgi:hypothetical protein